TRQRAEVEGEVASGLKTLVGIFLQAMADEAIERVRHARIQLDYVGGIVLENGVQRFDRRLAAEGLLRREHLEEHRSEREDVGAMVAGVAADLFGGHVADRAEEAARLGRGAVQRRRGLVNWLTKSRHAWLHQLDEAEVEDLHVPVARDEDVLRLQIA